MNNFVIGMKRFFKNKNVVTVILVIVILVVLYIGYSTSIKSQTNPVNVPVASRIIGPETKITNEDITFKTEANSMVGEGVILNTAAIVGKYTNINVTIPEGGMFYSSLITEEENIPGEWIEQLNHDVGELGYYMAVDMDSTLGNSIKPNSYIDIYMKAQDENGTVMFGKLMKNVKVLVVHDVSGKNVFGSGEDRTPARIGFGVMPDMYQLLKKSEFLDLDLIVAPRGYTVPTEDYVIVTSSTLRDYIDAQSITIDEDVEQQVNEETPAESTPTE